MICGLVGFTNIRTLYLSLPRIVTSSEDSHDLAVQQRLWMVSEELTGVTYPVPITLPR